jgi:hypothetical protein
LIKMARPNCKSSPKTGSKPFLICIWYSTLCGVEWKEPCSGGWLTPAQVQDLHEQTQELDNLCHTDFYCQGYI